MDLTASRIPEPILVFGNGGKHVDPKAGLALFGPSGHARGGEGPKSITVGFVGPQDSVEEARAWLQTLNKPIIHEKANLRLFPFFPGAPVAIGAALQCPENLVYEIPPRRLDTALRTKAHRNRINAVTSLFTEGSEVLLGKAGRPQVVVYAWSDSIMDACVGGSTQERLPREEREFRRQLLEQESSGQQRFFPLDSDAEGLLYSAKSAWNLHAQCKLEAMALAIRVPIQILEPATFRGESQESDPLTPWNLTSALYYKAGGIPWRPADPEPRTCYIGVEFFRDKTSTERRMRTCIAQVFSDAGEGLVLRGSQFEHTGALRQTPRMSQKVTEELLSNALSLFAKHNRQTPLRVVVHKSSHWVHAEKRGAELALANVESYDLTTIFRHPTIQFLRHGTQPPVRGTLVTLNATQFCIYTHGFTPYLGVYPGMRVPRPLLVTKHSGAAGPQKLAAEIMKLTKLNWNAARFSSQLPCTLMYAGLVKEVLSQAPPDSTSLSEDYNSYM